MSTANIELPTDRIVYQFENASVVYTADFSLATDRVMPKLDVMVIDQYRYQRELSVAFRHEPGDSKKLLWEYHAYRHPGRRYIGTISKSVGQRFINRFLDLCENYPSLLFNRAGEHTSIANRPRAEGFVHLSEQLLDGWEFSVKLLD